MGGSRGRSPSYPLIIRYDIQDVFYFYYYVKIPVPVPVPDIVLMETSTDSGFFYGSQAEYGVTEKRKHFWRNRGLFWERPRKAAVRVVPSGALGGNPAL